MSRYDLTGVEWGVIEPLLPIKPRGVPRVDDRRALNGIFWVLRSGSPWRALPERYGLPTACYNRFRRWTKAGVWDGTMDPITDAYGGVVRMVDGASVRVHHATATLKSHPDRCRRQSRGGLATKINSLTDCRWLAVEGDDHARPEPRHQGATELLADICRGQVMLADRGYDANKLRGMVTAGEAWGNIPPRTNRRNPICFSPWLYRKRNLIERFFNSLKYYRQIATRYNKLGSTFLAMTKLACIRLRVRRYQSTVHRLSIRRTGLDLERAVARAAETPGAPVPAFAGIWRTREDSNL